MSKSFKKMISALLSFIIVLSTIATITTFSASAYNYSSNYSLNGNWRDDIVSVAKAQYQKTKSELGYSVDWCAYFVSECGNRAGIPIFPYNGSCTSLVAQLKSIGMTWYSYASGYIPQKGGIIFFPTVQTMIMIT